MARLRVDTDSMQKLDANMKEWLASSADAMTKMRDSVGTLDGVWEGDNHEAFRQSFEERKDAVKAAALTIEKFSDSLSQAARLYMELEAEVADTVGKL